MKAIDVRFEGCDVYGASMGCAHGRSRDNALNVAHEKDGKRDKTDNSWGENSCFSST